MFFAALLCALGFRAGHASQFTEPIPEATTKVPPIYPDSVRRAGTRGLVVVQALVGKDGRVKETKVVRKVDGLDGAALAAVKQWVFRPTLANRSEEHTSELQSLRHLVCRLLLEKKKEAYQVQRTT